MDKTPRSLFIVSSLNLNLEYWLQSLIGQAELAADRKDQHEGFRVAGLLQQLDPPIGDYYFGLFSLRAGAYQLAEESFSRVIDSGPPVFRAKAMLSLRTVAHYKGDRDMQQAFTRLAIKTAADPVTLLEAKRGEALFYSEEGDHKKALDIISASFDSVCKITTHWPRPFYEYLNFQCVELIELGDIDSARRFLPILSRVPYRDNHFAETLTDLHILFAKERYKGKPVTGKLIVFPVRQAEASFHELRADVSSRTYAPTTTTYQLKAMIRAYDEAEEESLSGEDIS